VEDPTTGQAQKPQRLRATTTTTSMFPLIYTRAGQTTVPLQIAHGYCLNLRNGEIRTIIDDERATDPGSLHPIIKHDNKSKEVSTRQTAYGDTYDMSISFVLRQLLIPLHVHSGPKPFTWEAWKLGKPALPRSKLMDIIFAKTCFLKLPKLPTGPDGSLDQEIDF